MKNDKPSVLILTDKPSDAEVLHLVLVDDYPQTHVSTDPAQFGADFEKQRPQVLLFAFRSLEASEMYYVNLHRNSALTNTLPHISLVLCDKDDARRAYELCRSDFFDDYVLFWPLAHDARRLPMAVHLALRALDGQNAVGSMAQMTAQARRIAELDAQLESALEIGRTHTSKAQMAVRTARVQVHSALGHIAKPPDDADHHNGSGTGRLDEFRLGVAHLNEAEIQPSLRQADQAMQQLNNWIASFRSELAGPLDAVRTLAAKSKQLRPKILIVDDDEIMRKLLRRVLVAEHFEVETVGNAFAALKYLQTERPDLILMDVQMPSINGIQLTRQIKDIESYADIPIMMLTGQGERQIIVDSREAGAADFIVKPFDRDVLLMKLKKHILPPGAVE